MTLFGYVAIIKSNGEPNSKKFPLKHRYCVFGRHPQCEVLMNKDDIEEKHARIEVQHVTNRMFIVNLSNDDNVLLNSVPVPAKQKRQLADKDMISIKGRRFMVEIIGMTLFLITHHLRFASHR
jgi:hypothetical protein